MVVKVYDPDVGGFVSTGTSHYVEPSSSSSSSSSKSSSKSSGSSSSSSSSKTTTSDWEVVREGVYRQTTTKSDGTISQRVVYGEEAAKSAGVPSSLITSAVPTTSGMSAEEEAYYREKAVSGISEAAKESFVEKATVKEIEESGISVSPSVLAEKKLKESIKEKTILASPTVASAFLTSATPEEEKELIDELTEP